MGTWHRVADEDKPRRITAHKREWLDKGLYVVIGFELYRRVDWEECKKARTPWLCD